MAEKVWVALLSVVVGVGALAGAAWLIATAEVAGVERIFVILAALILALVAWLCLRLEFHGLAEPAAARSARTAAAPPRAQNPATGSRVHASTWLQTWEWTWLPRRSASPVPSQVGALARGVSRRQGC